MGESDLVVAVKGSQRGLAVREKKIDKEEREGCSATLERGTGYFLSLFNCLLQPMHIGSSLQNGSHI